MRRMAEGHTRRDALSVVSSTRLCPSTSFAGPPPLSGEAFLTFEFTPTKLPRRGEQAATAAVTLTFLQLKLGRKVSGDPPLLC